MKKKAVIVTRRNEMKEMYYDELVSIFSDRLNFDSYSMGLDHNRRMEINPFDGADVVLLSDADILKYIKHMINDDCKIIQLRYAFLKDNINTLKRYPKGTNALVCFNFTEVSTTAAMIIYEMGITNLNLTILDKNTALDQNYDIAIVGENSAVAPEEINTIISLGRRKISLMTLVDLSIVTEVFDNAMKERIMSYAKNIALPMVSMQNLLKNDLFSYSNIQTILDAIDDSIIILGKDFKITDYNTNVIKMFNMSEGIENKRLDEVHAFKPFAHLILENQNVENLLIEIEKHRNIMITIKKIEDIMDDNISYIISLKDVTDFIQLENTLKKQLERKGHVTKYSFDDIYSNSKKMKETIEKAKTIAKLDKPVLIIGESGTGKELFAQSIHNQSFRKSYPFVAINCAALSSTLLESELFGYEEGAFTGAKKGGNIGLFEIANNGTLFLDEIGDMPLQTQAKILRVLEEKEFMKLGGHKNISINVRIISATNCNLRDLIDEGKFRLDLYYRLNTLMFNIPPLRERKSDIRRLIELFSKDCDTKPITIDDEVKDFLTNHTWNGNVRELKNCIEYMVSISEGNLKMHHLPDYILEEIDYEERDMDEDIFHLLNEYEQRIIMELMHIVSYSGGGRRSVYEKLKQKYEDLSEYKTRKFIDLLSDNNLIEIGTGRAGMKLTEIGRKLLEEKGLQ